jgi:hypothetical protein
MDYLPQVDLCCGLLALVVFADNNGMAELGKPGLASSEGQDFQRCHRRAIV